jgi:type I restriction enzyme S subunit
MKQGILKIIETPQGWGWERLWSTSPRVKEDGQPQAEPLSVFLEAGVVPRSSRPDNHNQLGEDLSKYLVVQPGDVVFNKLRTWQGGLGVSKHYGIVSPAYFVCRPESTWHPRYLNFLLLSSPYLAELTRLSKFMPPSQFDISWDALRTLPLLRPPLDEQRRIADFLDAETTRHDLLRSSISARLNLLRAKRRAILLSIIPDRVNKPVRLGYFLSLVTSGPRGWGDFVGPKGTPFFRSANLRRDGIEPNLETLALVDLPLSTAAEALRSRVREGDVLIGITGANTGWVSLADAQIATSNVSQHVCLIRPGEFIEGKWLAYALSSPKIQDLLLGSQYGGTKTQLSLGDVRDLVIQLPSIEEQRKLTNQVQESLGLVEEECSYRGHQISLLAERRQALITAAVTGQIDVTTARGLSSTGGVSA